MVLALITVRVPSMHPQEVAGRKGRACYLRVGAEGRKGIAKPKGRRGRMSNKIQEERCYEYVKYQFGEEEKTAMGGQLAQCFNDHTEKEAALKSVTTQIKSEIAKTEAEMAGLAEKIRSGYEQRRVECKKILDFTLKTVEVIRLDTGETVQERPMNADEAQLKLKIA
jgi:hypothetical protein